MSVQGVYRGGLENTTPVTLSDGTQTDIYEAPDRFKTLAAFALVNTTASPITATCYHYDGSADNIFYKQQVAANSTEVIESVPRRMQSGDIFKVTAASGLVIAPVVFTGHINEVANNAGSNSLTG